jgi:hypothetical protein
MKRSYIILVLVVFAGICRGQSDSAQMVAKLMAVDDALVANDEKLLNELLHEQLFFGHSNGWVQNKQQVVNDLKSGLLAYRSFKNREFTWRPYPPDRVVLQEKVEVEVALRANPLQLKLLVTEEWIRENGTWKLLLRQGAKL